MTSSAIGARFGREIAMQQVLLDDVPADSRVVSFTVAEAATGVERRVLRRRMEECGIKTVRLGIRGGGLTVADLRAIIEASRR